MEQEFLDFIAGVMNVDSSEIGFGTEYGQYEKWDSLMMLTLIMEVEAEYGVAIPIGNVGQIKTLNDLWRMVGEGRGNG